MQDNSVHGKRLVFWLKFTLAVVAAEVLMVALAYGLFGEFFQSTEPASLQMSGSFFVLVLLIAMSAMVLVISVLISVVYWFLWLYRAVKNLRCLTTTTFSPWGAVICSIIPWVGQVLDYFILKDMRRAMEGVLQERGMNFAPIPMRFLNAWLIFTIASGILSFCGGSMTLTIVSSLFALVAYICAIKVVEMYVSQETVLLQNYQGEELRKKVDEVLREREIEKAASEVQAAMYEKAANDASSEPPPPPQNS